MSNDFVLVDPKAWEYDLHSIYSAYIGYFQVYNIPWYERSWGGFFESFDEFLGFSWPVITVTDSWTGKAHIVTRLTAIHSFIKMVKTRFGETLPQAPNILQVTPFETSQRRQRHVSDYVTYSRLYATLPAAHLAAVKTRVRSGEPKVIRELWEKRDKTFLAIDFEWNERNEHTVLEWGYAALRCGHLESSLSSPDSETIANTLVLVAHGLQGDLARLEEMKIKLPSNMLMIDTSVLERGMYNSGLRGVIMDPKTERPRLNGTTLSLEHLLISLTLPLINAPPSSTPDGSGSGSGKGGSTPHQHQHQHHPVVLPNCALHNAGNDAYMTLFALQHLLEPSSSRSTPPMTVKRHPQQQGMQFPSARMPMMSPLNPMLTGMSSMSGMPLSPPQATMGMPMGSPMQGSMMLPPFANFGMQVVPPPHPNGNGVFSPNGMVSPPLNGGSGGGGGLAVPNLNGTFGGGSGNNRLSSMGPARPKSAYDLAGEFGALMSEKNAASSLSKATGAGANGYGENGGGGGGGGKGGLWMNRPRFTSSPNLKNGK
ncbi:hypothetical protein EST38_g11796 [Candolleomyces aberdarensis]|uniref:Uncharacterized protein n=1 Tax=Candolleomyces aberdarensis TaxID=2316362 RepID=A0A4Q2D4P9_9AGAR|nr:hypothetical protein EST38_g11796 [Candolleomyces aberdarensis]